MKTKIDWQLTSFWIIAYAIAWSIGFTFGVDDEAIRATYSPIVATNLIYLPKFAFTISGVILFWYTGRFKGDVDSLVQLPRQMDMVRARLSGTRASLPRLSLDLVQ